MRGLASTRCASTSLFISMIWPIDAPLALPASGFVPRAR